VNSVATIAALCLWREVDKFHHKNAGDDRRRQVLPNRHIYADHRDYLSAFIHMKKGPTNSRAFLFLQADKPET
jgi:hypothetical protein